MSCNDQFEQPPSAYCPQCALGRHSRLITDCDICGHRNVPCGFELPSFNSVCKECCIKANTCIECGEAIKT
jgi:hypothetical protein